MWFEAFRPSGRRGIVEAIIQSKSDLFKVCANDDYLLIGFLRVQDVVKGEYDGCQVA